MVENERDIVFSESVKAGKRIYYFDVKETRSGEKFLTITESKKVVEGGADSPNAPFTFQKHKIFLYKEDYDKFLAALSRTISVARGDNAADEALAMEGETYDTGTVSIDIDF